MIKYIAHYNTSDNEEKRMVSGAGRAKAEYIAYAIEAAGYDLEIISASNTTSKENAPQKKKLLSDRVSLVLLKGYGRGGKIKNKISTLMFHLQLLRYLIKDLNKNDTVIVYHSLILMPLIRIAKRIRRFKLILEVEEIYGDVLEKDKVVDAEMQYFKTADAYIFPTGLLNTKINKSGKPFAICHGTYKVETDRNTSFQDNKIHCVYAGTFSRKKGGCWTAISAAAYLPENYHLHVLGQGSKETVSGIIKQAESISQSGGCKVTYEGFKSGEEYVKFIQTCDIGLSTQNPDAAFNDTSFPSKVLMYLANGLRVVSVRIPVIQISAVNDLIYYFDTQSPESIAKAITEVDLNDDYDSRSVIEELHTQFVYELRRMIENRQ